MFYLHVYVFETSEEHRKPGPNISQKVSIKFFEVGSARIPTIIFTGDW